MRRGSSVGCAWLFLTLFGCQGGLTSAMTGGDDGKKGPDAPKSVPATQKESPPDPLAALGPLPPSLKRDWLEKDVKILRQVTGALPIKEGASSQELLQALGVVEDKQISRRDLGFGGESLFISFGGGYTGCWVQALSHQGKLFEAGVRCRGSEPSWAEVLPLAKKVVGAALTDAEGGALVYEYKSSAPKGALESAVRAELGEVPAAEPSEDLKAAYEVLSSGLGLTVGFACGAAGAPPFGRLELNRLLDAKRQDLLRAALRGVSPEGRVYAALGLIVLESEGTPIDEADDAAIEKLRALPLKLNSCNGCVQEQQTAAELLPGEGNDVTTHASGRAGAVPAPPGAAAAAPAAPAAPASRAALFPAADFKLTLACDQMGAALVRREVKIEAGPIAGGDATITVTQAGEQKGQGILTPKDLAPLGAILASPKASALMAEKPTPGADHPGMSLCSCVAESAFGKQEFLWKTSDSLSPQGEETKRQLVATIRELEKKIAAP